jgi:allantoin racemase
MSRQTAWGHYNVALRRILDRVKDPDTEIEVHGITKRGGLADQFHYLDYLESGEVMENVQIATKRGFDAFLIGNIGDPGIHSCREITTIPVLGLCETALHTACLMGQNFSLVTINEKFTPRIIDNVHRYKMERRLSAVNRMTIDRINDLDAGFTNAAARKRIFDQFMKAANANVEQGAEVIIAAGGVVMALLAEFGVHQAAKNTPILNGIVSLVKMGEAEPHHGRQIPQQAPVLRPSRDGSDRRNPQVLRRCVSDSAGQGGSQNRCGKTVAQDCQKSAEKVRG